MTLSADVDSILQRIGVHRDRYRYGERAVRSPLTGETIGQVKDADAASVSEAIAQSEEAFLAWRSFPAPRRGEFVRLLGEELRAGKTELDRPEWVTSAGSLELGAGNGLAKVKADDTLGLFELGAVDRQLSDPLARRREDRVRPQASSPTYPAPQHPWSLRALDQTDVDQMRLVYPWDRVDSGIGTRHKTPCFGYVWAAVVGCLVGSAFASSEA